MKRNKPVEESMFRLIEGRFLFMVLFCLGCGARAFADEGQRLLQILRDADAAFFAGVVLSITITEPEGLAWDMGQVTMEGALTVSGKSRGLVLETVCFQPPEYVKPKPGHDEPGIYYSSRSYDYDDAWNMVFGRQQQHIALKTVESSELFMQSTRVRVAPSGTITEGPGSRDLIRSPACDEEMTLHLYRRILLAAGRGYGQFITSVDEVKTLSSGLLELIVAGGPPWRGRWTLTVDPALDYLVRSAVWGSQEKPSKVISTAGTQVQDGLTLPLEGTVTCVSGGRADLVTMVEFKEVSRSRHREVIQDLKKRLTEDLPAGTSIIDYRENPEHPLFRNHKREE